MPSNKSGPGARRPGNATRLRARADGIQATKRREAVQAGRRLRIGFQIALLAVIGLLAFVLIFPTLKLYMAQQVQTEQLEAKVESAAQINEELEAQLKRWEDPAYVKAQARQRLSYAMPGDRTFRVSDPENAPAVPAARAPEPEPPTHLAESDAPEQPDPWYAQLWQSVVVAGNVEP
ncbi:MAG: septum formation initiator family protein [Bifidobacteriaceae bacterium]|jgi:cell division protein FtsB|nr:septum formation initiator family protein [Bifidobacteriaceae bacterium]